MVGACGPMGLMHVMLVRSTLQGYIESIRRQSLLDLSTLIAALQCSNEIEYL